jgi:hypothetical protein
VAVDRDGESPRRMRRAYWENLAGQSGLKKAKLILSNSLINGELVIRTVILLPFWGPRVVDLPAGAWQLWCPNLFWGYFRNKLLGTIGTLATTVHKGQSSPLYM